MAGRPRPVLVVPDLAQNELGQDYCDSKDDINVLIYLPILKSMFHQFARCPTEACGQTLCLGIDLSQKKGLCHVLVDLEL